MHNRVRRYGLWPCCTLMFARLVFAVDRVGVCARVRGLVVVFSCYASTRLAFRTFIARVRALVVLHVLRCSPV